MLYNGHHTLNIVHLPSGFYQNFRELKGGGFNWAKVAEAVQACALAQKKDQAEKDEAKVKQAVYLPSYQALTKEFGLDNRYGPVQIYATTTGIQISFEHCITPEQARALLETAKKVGLL